MDWIQQWQSKLNKQNGVAPLVRTGGSRHTGLAALPYRNIHGNLLLGYQDRNGTVKMTCKSCQAAIVRRMMGRRHHRLDVYAPE